MTIAQEVELKLKMYEGLNNDDLSAMQVSAVPHSEVLAVHGIRSPPGNTSR